MTLACPGPGPFPFQSSEYDDYDEAYSEAGYWSEEDAWGYYDQSEYDYDDGQSGYYNEQAGNYSSEMTDEYGNMYAFEYDESWFEDPED